MDQLTAPVTAHPAAHDWTAVNRAHFARRFRRAARHSQIVRALRIAVPVAVAGLGVVLVVAWINPFQKAAPPPINTAALALSGSKITMELPRLAGFTRDSRAYEFSARSAAQDVSEPDKVELSDISAKVEIQDRGTVQMIAPLGVYDTKAEQLRLSKHIALSSSAGYEARLKEAIVEVRSGRIVSEQPVEVKLLNGMLNANRLEVSENGAVVLFGGGVNMTLTLAQPLTASTAVDKAKTQ